MLLYLLLGWVVSQSFDGKKRVRMVIKASLITSGVVATFGVLQYFLPKDMLSHVGYSLERGMKVMFFIDDKPDLPRVMSTLRDPNSLAAYLSVPITYSVYYLFLRRNKIKESLLSSRWLTYLLVVSLLCMAMTFSRSGLITVFVALASLVVITTKNKKALTKKFAPIAAVVAVAIIGTVFVFKDTYVFKNLIFHADEATVQQDPNEQRITLWGQAVEHIQDYPLGKGPGTAGIVSIINPNGAALTENYYLQIAYEVGIPGLILFVGIWWYVLWLLYIKSYTDALAAVIFCAGVGIAVFALLNHAWSNEALSLAFWLPAGLAIGQSKKQ